jgi:hypothetical protein
VVFILRMEHDIPQLGPGWQIRGRPVPDAGGLRDQPGAARKQDVQKQKARRPAGFPVKRSRAGGYLRK